MSHTPFSRLLLFIGLVLLQVLVFNHIHIMGYATPMPYIYFLLTLPTQTKHWVYVLLGFLMGIPLDIFGNTPGVTMITLTFCGLITPLYFKIFGVSQSDDEPIEPSIKSMEAIPFMRFAFSMILTACMVFFTVESFNMFNYLTLGINILASTFLTFLIVMAMALIRKSR